MGAHKIHAFIFFGYSYKQRYRYFLFIYSLKNYLIVYIFYEWLYKKVNPESSPFY